MNFRGHDEERFERGAARTRRAAGPRRGAPVSWWISEPPGADVRAAVERLARAEDVHQVAVMPDVHLAGPVCVGAVVATGRLIYPQAVGGDIGCGMAAARFDVEAGVVQSPEVARRILAALPADVPILRRPRLADCPELDGDLAPAALSDRRLTALARRVGRVELGTLGRGNHFLEWRSDEQGGLWAMVHSGSRGLGPEIARLHMERAARGRGGLLWLDADTPAGQAYVHDAAWAERYARESRMQMITAAAAVLRAVCGLKRVALCGPVWDMSHNHVRRELFGATSYWVHRKGANPAADGEPGIIPGSMNAGAYLVRGRGCAAALRSSSHGSGRRLARGAARARISEAELRRQLVGLFFDERLASELRDEAPGAYRDVDAVLRAQRQLVRVARRLTPILCYKGVG